MIYRKFIKRLLDILLSGLALLLLLPLMLVLIVLIRVKLGSPVFFRQERPGYHEKIFMLIKFRTMTDAKDESGKLLPDRDRLTKFGLFLRKTSLDELPELWNIFIGQMSIIGPRPLRTYYLPWYTERERLRHTVRPGLTGLAQVSGRNMIDWDARLEKDAVYVENLSFALDVKIIVMTVETVLGKGDEVAVDTNAAEGVLSDIRRAKKEQEEAEALAKEKAEKGFG